MSTTEHKLPLHHAQRLANRLVQMLEPHCLKIDIAGSIRRESPLVGDIEIVCQPQKIESGLLGMDPVIIPDFFHALSIFKRLMGKPENKNARYLKYELPTVKGDSLRTVTLDLFIPQPADYYRILAIRTGSKDFAHLKIAGGWIANGWVGTDDGLRINDEVERKGEKWVCNLYKPTLPPVWQSEREFFDWLGIEWVEPINRK
jgi:DNA polymerase/3'-5' exonuclease PolX